MPQAWPEFAGQLTAVNLSSGNAAFAYYAVGNRTLRPLVDGIIASIYTYDDDWRLTALAHGSRLPKTNTAPLTKLRDTLLLKLLCGKFRLAKQLVSKSYLEKIHYA